MKQYIPMARVRYVKELVTLTGTTAAIVIEVNHEDSSQWTMAGIYPVTASVKYPYAGQTFISLNVLETLSDLVGNGYRLVIG